MSGAALAADGRIAVDQAPPIMVLPPLREDLHLHEGPRGRDGAPSWTLEDPARSRFFRIGWPEVEMLARWDLRDPECIADAVADATTLDTSGDDVRDFAGFLASSNLLQVSGKDANMRLQRQAAQLRTSGAMWLLKNYLFVRVPLLRPDRFLAATLPLVQPLFSRAFFNSHCRRRGHRAFFGGTAMGHVPAHLPALFFHSWRNSRRADADVRQADA